MASVASASPTPLSWITFAANSFLFLCLWGDSILISSPGASFMPTNSEWTNLGPSFLSFVERLSSFGGCTVIVLC